MLIFTNNQNFKKLKYSITRRELYELIINNNLKFKQSILVEHSKKLIHSSDVCSKLLYPIGYFSEPHESRNKDSKRIRLHHTRKINRVLTNTDHFKHLFITSDPLISTLSLNIGKFRKRNKVENEELVEIERLIIKEDINETSNDETMVCEESNLENDLECSTDDDYGNIEMDETDLELPYFFIVNKK